MIELEKLGPPELASASAIFRRRLPATVQTAAGLLTVEPVPVAAGEAGSFRLDLRLGEGRCQLTAEEDLVERLLAADLPGLDLQTLDPELRSLVLELGMAPLLTAAEAALGRAVRLAPGPPPTALPYKLDLRASLDGTGWPVRLLLDLRGLEALTRAYERAPVQRDPMPELVLPLSAVAGRTRLSMAELDRARAGDLLVLEEAPVALGRLDLMAGDMLAFACRLEGTSLVYAGEVTSRVAGESGAIAERLDEAPVELVFELGRLSVPLGELRSLAAGHVFDLGRDLRHPVDILLGGRKVGEGELVQVGERVGVRLRSLVPR